MLSPSERAVLPARRQFATSTSMKWTPCLAAGLQHDIGERWDTGSSCGLDGRLDHERDGLWFHQADEYANFRPFMPALSLPLEAWDAAQDEQIRACRQNGIVARQVTVTVEKFKTDLGGRAPNGQQLFLCASAIARKQADSRTSSGPPCSRCSLASARCTDQSSFTLFNRSASPRPFRYSRRSCTRARGRCELVGNQRCYDEPRHRQERKQAREASSALRLEVCDRAWNCLRRQHESSLPRNKGKSHERGHGHD